MFGAFLLDSKNSSLKHRKTSHVERYGMTASVVESDEGLGAAATFSTDPSILPPAKHESPLALGKLTPSSLNRMLRSFGKMGIPSDHALPEFWTELNVAQRQKKTCAERIEAIKASCRQECGHDNISAHPQWYAKAIEAFRARYMESEEREWFAQRRAFLQELDGLFQDTKDGKRTLRSIQARIESEKEAWYRWVLRRYPAFIAVSDSGVDQDEIRGMLDNPDISRGELLQTMLRAVGTPSISPADFAESVGRVSADPAELRRLHAAQFFTDQSTGQPLEHADRYLDQYRTGEYATVEDVIDRIMEDLQRSRSAQPQRESLQRRLRELRAAKALYEQDKMQTKGPKSAHAVATAPELYNLPPCSVCGKQVPSEGSLLSCSVCQAIVQAGGQGSLTVYCSDECHAQGHGTHVDSHHDCEAGDDCAQLYDQDMEMDDGGPSTVCCNECLEQKQATLYCSARCAVANVEKHRRANHGHGGSTTAEEAGSLVCHLQSFVEETLRAKNPGTPMTMMYL